jgi:hypothetical protein
MDCGWERTDESTVFPQNQPCHDAGRGASRHEMHPLRDSARCALYESGLRRAWQ